MALLLELDHEHNWAWGFAAGSVIWPGGGVPTERGMFLPSGKADLPACPCISLHVSTKQALPGFTMTIPHHKPCSLQHWCLVLKQPLAMQQPNEDGTWNPHKDARGFPAEKEEKHSRISRVCHRGKKLPVPASWDFFHVRAELCAQKGRKTSILFLMMGLCFWRLTLLLSADPAGSFQMFI